MSWKHLLNKTPECLVLVSIKLLQLRFEKLNGMKINIAVGACISSIWLPTNKLWILTSYCFCSTMCSFSLGMSIDLPTHPNSWGMVILLKLPKPILLTFLLLLLLIGSMLLRFTGKKQGHLLLSWLISSLIVGIHTKLIGMPISNEVWISLKKQFSSQSHARLMQLHLQLQTIRKGSLLLRSIFFLYRVPLNQSIGTFSVENFNVLPLWWNSRPHQIIAPRKVLQ